MNVQLQELQFGLQLVNLLVIPLLLGIGRAWWAMEKRMLKIEMKLGIEDRA